ncbi:Hypothetical protein FKW44_009384, partial [Caligus rogercresseyi]
MQFPLKITIFEQYHGFENSQLWSVIFFDLLYVCSSKITLRAMCITCQGFGRRKTCPKAARPFLIERLSLLDFQVTWLPRGQKRSQRKEPNNGS